MLILPHNSSTIWYLLYQINFHNLRIIFQDNFRKKEGKKIKNTRQKNEDSYPRNNTRTNNRCHCTPNDNHNEIKELLQKKPSNQWDLTPKITKILQTKRPTILIMKKYKQKGQQFTKHQLKIAFKIYALGHHRNNIHGCDRVIFHPTQSN